MVISSYSYKTGLCSSRPAQLFRQKLSEPMKEEPTSNTPGWHFHLKRVQNFAKRVRPFASGAIGALIILILYNRLVPPPTPLTLRDVENSIAQAMASATPPPAISAQVYQIIQPSLVLIELQGRFGQGGSVQYESDAESDGLYYVQDEDGVAAGVIVNDSGDILTSLHVVAEAKTLWVTFADGTYTQAEVVGTLPDNDIAVLRTELLPPEIVPATLGNPNAMRIGDEAFVVGHPFGLYASMSAGVISGFHRTFESPTGEGELTDLIQFDAATNPGASGGPLLNRYGQVVGIVSRLLNPTSQEVFIGIGLAVPITIAGGAAGLPPQ
jgi:S1-C subfamily serine protease